MLEKVEKQKVESNYTLHFINIKIKAWFKYKVREIC
jgi:hypothetical protein